MNILEAVLGMKDASQRGAVLVARPPLTWGAEAMFVDLTDDYRVPQPILDAGFQYLMGAEDLSSVLEYVRKKKISEKAIAEFVIHYAMVDSAPAWIDDIPEA